MAIGWSNCLRVLAYSAVSASASSQAPSATFASAALARIIRHVPCTGITLRGLMML